MKRNFRYPYGQSANNAQVLLLRKAALKSVRCVLCLRAQMRSSSSREGVHNDTPYAVQTPDTL